jgi:hypothetical protein
MSEPTERRPRLPHYKQQIDWLKLILEVRGGRTCVEVASSHGVPGWKLQRRVRKWDKAQKEGDDFQVAVAEGRADGRLYNNSALTPEDEKALAGELRADKGEHCIVTRGEVKKRAIEFWAKRHPHPTRSTPSFVVSQQWVTRFRHRHGFSTTKHKATYKPPLTPAQEDDRIDKTAEFLIHTAQAVEEYGPRSVLNADETAALAVQQPFTSWGVRGQPNVVGTSQDKRRGITTMPTISMAGDRLPLQAVVKGKTKLAVKNKKLPSDVLAYPSQSSWQNQDTLIGYMHDGIAPYTHNEPSALLLDDYKAHHTDKVHEKAAEHNIDIIPVPAGQTSTLQPLDVGVNGQLKARARKKWVADKVSGKENADTLGRAVGRMNEAYHETPASTLTSSFTKAVSSLPR